MPPTAQPDVTFALQVAVSNTVTLLSLALATYAFRFVVSSAIPTGPLPTCTTLGVRPQPDLTVALHVASSIIESVSSCQFAT